MEISDNMRELISKIIYATTSEEHPGCCDVIFDDGSAANTLGFRISELYDELNRISTRGRYFMIDRSSLICENNIIKINPSRGELVMACDSLGKRHQKLSFSDDLLRRLRSNISE